ncbi:hypothetical protein V6N13_138280 [Hibiscus sabdariffa]
MQEEHPTTMTLKGHEIMKAEGVRDAGCSRFDYHGEQIHSKHVLTSTEQRGNGTKHQKSDRKRKMKQKQTKTQMEETRQTSNQRLHRKKQTRY